MQFKTEAKRNVYHCQVKKTFCVTAKSLELVDGNQILTWRGGKKKKTHIGLRCVGFATRVAGVQSTDVVLLMCGVVTYLLSTQGDWSLGRSLGNLIGVQKNKKK